MQRITYEAILYISLWYISFLSSDIFYELSLQDENIKKVSKPRFLTTHGLVEVEIP